MAFPPTPLRISCNKCHSSITWSPKSDAFDPDEGFALIQCTKCGSKDIEFRPLDKTYSAGTMREAFSWLKKQFGG